MVASDDQSQSSWYYFHEHRFRVPVKIELQDAAEITQQANGHCAYGDGIYDQIGFSELEIQIHNSWLFFPFHQWELYFYEKILGKLIRDDNFVMPFWYYDHPNRMTMPVRRWHRNCDVFMYKGEMTLCREECREEYMEMEEFKRGDV